MSIGMDDSFARPEQIKQRNIYSKSDKYPAYIEPMFKKKETKLVLRK